MAAIALQLPVAGADLILAVTPRWHAAAVALPSAVFNNDAGQSLRVTRFAALVSGVQLLKRDGATVRLDGQFGLLDVGNRKLEVTLRGVPEDEYVGLEFLLGVPPDVNHADSGRWPAGHPLNPIVNGLHWSWQGGYIFAALEGHWQESTEVAEPQRGFSFHLATDARLMIVRLLSDYRVEGDTVVDLAVDLGRVLAGHRLSAMDGSDSTHSAAGDALAERLSQSLERAWFWLGARKAFPRERPREFVAQSAAEAVAGATPFAFTVPAGFPQPALPADNPLSWEGIELGERLFSDPRLSSTGAQSCASCHSPANAFSDHVALSSGARGGVGTRNAMPLFNLAWSPSFAWDGSKPRIRDQAHAAWANPAEMDADVDAVVSTLCEDAALKARVARAFGDSEITAERITLALEQFLLTRVSADSRFDRALRGEAVLTEREQRGFELFATEFDPARGRRGADCFHCHGGTLFTDYAVRSNGLKAASSDNGYGRDAEARKFKTPSLRNVALTAPYMHDGRFATLSEVVAHYDHGVERSASLDPNLAKHPDAGLALAPDDQDALVAFLKTLTGVSWSSPTRGPVAHSSPSQ